MTFFQSLLFFIMLIDLADSHPSFAIPMLKMVIKNSCHKIYRHKDNKVTGV